MVIVEKQAKEAGHNAPRYVRSLARYMETAKRGTSAEEYGLTLTRYMAVEKAAGRPASTERVLATGGLVGERAVEWNVALVELNARMNKRSSRSKKPARHLVGSVHVDEDITPDACGEMAAILAEELGCEAGIIMWALHGDTDNRHLHFLVLTLDENGVATPFGREGRSYKAMQRAIARIEHDHGFTREPGTRYEVRDGEVQRTVPAPRPTKVRAPIRTDVLRSEAATGVESFTRYAQDMLAPRLDAAGSWDEAQAAFAPLGARVVKCGSGGEIRSGDGHHKVKLSNVDRALSWAKLTERWGDWSETSIEPAPYEPRILDPQRASRWAQRVEQTEALHTAVQARIDRLKVERKAVLDNIRREDMERRADLAGLIGDPLDLARLRLSHNAICRRRSDRIKGEYRDRTAALRELRIEIDETDVVDGIALNDIAVFERSLSIDWACRPAQPVSPPGFMVEAVGQSFQYWRDDLSARRPAFVERGDRIWIYDSSDDSVRAALIVAQARYGVVAARGDPAFVAEAQRLGRELGIDVQDGAVTTVPSARSRSPRIQQRRDAVRRWEAGARNQRGASGVDLLRTDQRPHQQSATPAHQENVSLGRERERRAILARVARLLADDDWDPRDYRRTAPGKGWHGREHPQDVANRMGTQRSLPASRQARNEQAGRGR